MVAAGWQHGHGTSVVMWAVDLPASSARGGWRRRLRKTDVDVTIISPVDYMLYTPLLPDVAGGVVDARFVAIPLAGTLKGVRAIAAEWITST